MAATKMIKFRFAPEKALAAIHWMIQQQLGVDLHTLLKACYFADKKQLKDFGKPVFGARYRAMPFGPVPLEIYEMAKGEAIWLAELGLDSYPWQLDGYKLRLIGNAEPNLRSLSRADKDALESGFNQSRDMTFSRRTAATHGPDWQAAKLGRMRYEDMLIDTPDKDERIDYLREAAPNIRL